MPIANPAQARYYDKKKLELLAKMRTKYIDEEKKQKDKKKEYYNENKQEILDAVKARYYASKEVKNKDQFMLLLNENPNDSIKAEINEYINTDKYKTANKKIFDALKNKIELDKNI
jgi:hypothetical protein